MDNQEEATICILWSMESPSSSLLLWLLWCGVLYGLYLLIEVLDILAEVVGSVDHGLRDVVLQDNIRTWHHNT